MTAPEYGPHEHLIPRDRRGIYLCEGTRWFRGRCKRAATVHLDFPLLDVPGIVQEIPFRYCYKHAPAARRMNDRAWVHAARLLGLVREARS